VAQRQPFRLPHLWRKRYRDDEKAYAGETAFATKANQ
jgi:hypothetical protein